MSIYVGLNHRRSGFFNYDNDTIVASKKGVILSKENKKQTCTNMKLMV